MGALRELDEKQPLYPYSGLHFMVLNCASENGTVAMTETRLERIFEKCGSAIGPSAGLTRLADLISFDLTTRDNCTHRDRNPADPQDWFR